jgi:hypothetical protein
MRFSWRSVLIVAAVTVVTAASALAAPTPGKYAGTTSEHGTVAFTVTSGGKTITAFTTTDGYNAKCKFHGGVGGIPNFTISIPSVPISTSGVFNDTVKAKLGPFSGNFQVKGKVEGGKASGTVDEVGNSCGKGAANPTVHDYLETFQASTSG